jgi:hypothetical protein
MISLRCPNKKTVLAFRFLTSEGLRTSYDGVNWTLVTEVDNEDLISPILNINNTLYFSYNEEDYDSSNPYCIL